MRKLHEARQKQFADNDARVKSAAQKEREQFLETVASQKRLEAQEREVMARRRDAYLTYKDQLNAQMRENEDVRQGQKH